MATYPASEGLTSVQIAALVHEHKDRMRDVLEPLPARIRALERLPDRSAAIDAAHFGDQEGGRRRLAFDEFLLLQIALLSRSALRREGARGEPLDHRPRSPPAGCRTPCRSPRPATRPAPWPWSTRTSRRTARCSAC